jgi:hypothetical protein
MTTLVSCSRIVIGDVLPVYARSFAPRQKCAFLNRSIFIRFTTLSCRADGELVRVLA